MKTFFVVATRLVFEVVEVAAENVGAAASKVYRQEGIRDTVEVFEDWQSADKEASRRQTMANDHPRLA